MQLFSDEYTRVGGDIIIPIYISLYQFVINVGWIQDV
jgi:hypothetical protein